MLWSAQDRRRVRTFTSCRARPRRFLLGKVVDARTLYPDASDLYVGHSLTGGAADLKDAVAQDENVTGIVLLSGFLRRIWRESVSTCEGTWASQPKHECPSGVGLPLCPGGYSPDGVHACSGPEEPTAPTVTTFYRSPSGYKEGSSAEYKDDCNRKSCGVPVAIDNADHTSTLPCSRRLPPTSVSPVTAWMARLMDTGASRQCVALRQDSAAAG